MKYLGLALALLAVADVHGFGPSKLPSRRLKLLPLEAIVSYKQIQRIGYYKEVNKPLGIVFGENDPPFNGLTILEVMEGGNGEAAGMQVGHQLLSVNGKSVVGDDFDTAMDLLREGKDPLDIQLYEGTVRQLFTILKNVESDDDDEDEEEYEEPIVMDENYVSPVVVPDDDEEEPLSAGEIFGALKNMGSKMLEKQPEKENTNTKKKGGGLFGMFQQESIQLDGDDASSLN